MKMNKQHIFFPLLNGDEENAQVSGNRYAVLQWVSKLFASYSIIYQKVKAWAATYLDGQILAADGMVQEKSQIHSYNFLATPQSLFLLPGYSKKIKNFPTYTSAKN